MKPSSLHCSLKNLLTARGTKHDGVGLVPDYTKIFTAMETKQGKRQSDINDIKLGQVRIKLIALVSY